MRAVYTYRQRRIEKRVRRKNTRTTACARDRDAAASLARVEVAYFAVFETRARTRVMCFRVNYPYTRVHTHNIRTHTRTPTIQHVYECTTHTRTCTNARYYTSSGGYANGPAESGRTRALTTARRSCRRVLRQRPDAMYGARNVHHHSSFWRKAQSDDGRLYQ